MDVVTREEFDKAMATVNATLAQLLTKEARVFIPIREAAKRLGVCVRTVARNYPVETRRGRRYVRQADLEN